MVVTWYDCAWGLQEYISDKLFLPMLQLLRNTSKADNDPYNKWMNPTDIAESWIDQFQRNSKFYNVLESFKY